MFSIPDLLDNSIDYSLSFKTSKLLQTTEYKTADRTEKSRSNSQNSSKLRHSAESNSGEGSTSDTIVVDHVLAPDSLIQAPIEANTPPLLP